MVGDTIGDFIIRLKNAGVVGHKTVSVPYSKLCHAIADKVAQKTLEVTLKYEDGAHRINGVKRVSKPGRRLYTKVESIHQVKFGKGHLILSTPAGILTNIEAKAKNVGGEQLFLIW